MKRITGLFIFLLLFRPVSFTQEIEITGKVTSADDESALPGVSVVVGGTTLGVITDIDGIYKITAPTNATLVFSFIGMIPQEVSVEGRTEINIAMQPDLKELEEIVVTALGISRRRKTLGYSISEFKSEDLDKVYNLDAIHALQGKVAGVSIAQSSGLPGASTRVLIRGISSLTGSNQPLFVIDGVPINNSYQNANSTESDLSSSRKVDFGNAASDINPDDIELYTLLKGAAATSLYGSRAANGVIQITTKDGKGQEGIKVDFSSTFAVTEVGRLPYYQDKFGQGWNGEFFSNENGSWGPALNGEERLLGNEVNNSQRVQKYSYQENGLRDFFEYGYNRDNSIALSGGNGILGYRISYSNTKADGVIPTDVDALDKNAISLKVNGDHEKTKIDFGLNYINKKISTIATGQGDDAGGGKTLFQELLQIPVNHYVPLYRDYKGDFDNIDNYYTPYTQNPYFVINETKSDINQHRIISNLNIEQNLYKNIDLEWKGGLDNLSYAYVDYGNKAIVNEGSENYGIASDVKGMVKEEARLSTEINSDLMLKYNGKLELGVNTLKFNAIIGNNIGQRTDDRKTIIAKGLVVPGYINVRNISGSPDVSTYKEKRRTAAAYAHLALDYNNFLFVQLAARNDWSSTLPKDNNSYFYPGINTGFVFTELLNKNKILSFGKVRAGYAVAGNDAEPYQIDPYFAVARIRAGDFGLTIYPVEGVSAYENGSVLGNPNLRPEISKEIEVGTELWFFNYKIGVDFAYYRKVTTDLIMLANIASSSGFYWQTTNIGQITNNGIELKLDFRPVETNNFNWDITYIFTKENPVLDKLSKELGVSEYLINSAFDVEFMAIPGEQIGQYRIPDYKWTPSGGIIVGENGIPKEGDKILYGSSVPDYNMALSNTFSYKSFSLSVLFDYQEGGLIYSNTARDTYWPGNNEQSVINGRRPWVIPYSFIEIEDSEGNITYEENSTPIYNNWEDYFSSTTNKPNARLSLLDKTYVKLREATLSYTFSKSLLKESFVSSATISLYGRNLFLWTPAGNSFIDPETSTYGNDLVGMFGEFSGAPSVRNYGLKLNLSF